MLDTRLPGGDYVLRAELRPVPDDPTRGPLGTTPILAGTGAMPAVPEGGDPRDARAVTHSLISARRRGGALLLVAVLVPAAALVMVAAAIQLADHLDARRAQLDPVGFARISVGDARSDVQRLLPTASLEPPRDADPSCDYYAVTADPLADASGDAYRICWSGDHVASTDLVVGGVR